MVRQVTTQKNLTDRFVALLWDGQRVPSYHIDSSAIADLEIEKNQENGPVSAVHDATANIELDNTIPQPDSNIYSLPSSTGEVPAPLESVPQPFQDPAILSFSRPPLASHPSNTAPNPIQAPKLVTTLSSETIRAKEVVPTFSHSISSISTSSYTDPATNFKQKSGRKDSVTTATLHEPFSQLELNAESELDGNSVIEVTRIKNVPEGRIGAAPLEAPVKYTGKRSRRGKGKLTKDGSSQTASVPSVEDAGTQQKKSQFKSKGWRQTPLVEDQDPTTSLPQRGIPGTNGPTLTATQKKNAKRRQKMREEQNGWATEDATDIQDMGDFDFESNLSKFDKRKVFDQIRNDDTTADEDRLVSFNRKPRPGTNGGRNLHYTENVLDSPTVKPKWISEETDEEDHASSGRNSRRAMSRASTRQVTATSRKGSAILGQAPLSSLHLTSISRAQYTSSRTESPRPTKNIQTASPLNGSVIMPNKASFRIVGSNRPCPCVSPLQMLEVEQLSISDLGLSEDIITENAGRGIAETALLQVADASYSTSILLLVGNHKTGSRAIAAARHLRNHNVRVTVCILGIEREHELLDSLRKQLEVYRKVGGKTSRWDELSGKLTSSEWTMDLVIDALFGMHIQFEDLRTDDSATAFEMISWVNRSEANVLSIDVPSGLMAASGTYFSYQHPSFLYLIPLLSAL
jgi:enhancer of mRNA-decapping protein 3